MLRTARIAALVLMPLAFLALAAPAAAARIEGLTGTGLSSTVFEVRGTSEQYNVQVFGTWSNPTDAQDETSYDNSPTTEGVFVGGTGHAGSDVLTMSDGTLVTVDNVAGGVVDQFTVDSSASTGAVAADVLTQVSSTGSGVDFTLTPDADNITGASGKLQYRCGSVFDAALPWHDMPGTGAPYTADAEEGNIGLGWCQVGLNLTAVGTATDLDVELTGDRSETIRVVTP